LNKEGAEIKKNAGPLPGQHLKYIIQNLK